MNSFKNYCALILMLMLLSVFNFGQETERKVEGKTIFSAQNPRIKIQLRGDFEFVGQFDFKIKDVAGGERYIFADTRQGKVRRLFILQFEAILPASNEIFRYNFDKAQLIGGHKFRSNTFAFSNTEARRENPQGEAALTEKLLKEKGFGLEDELMTARFVTVPDEAKKHELILFYVENVDSTKYRLTDFYNGEEETEVWKKLSADLLKRAMKSFKIRPL